MTKCELKIAGNVPIERRNKERIQPCEQIRRLSNRISELYPKSLSRRMLATGSAIAIGAISAWQYEEASLAIAGVLLTLTSINYWRKPKKGFRRNLDILTCLLVTSFHFYQSAVGLEKEIFVEYSVKLATGIFMYFISKWGRINGNLHMSSSFHCMMHLWGIVANIWLYRQLYLEKHQPTLACNECDIMNVIHDTFL